VDIRSPRFTGQGWLAFPALRAAYKHVQLELEFRPEAWDGILFLTGERDDMAGDFMALLLHQGFVEFRYATCISQLMINIYRGMMDVTPSESD
jgi:hypothetical protein